MSVMNHAHQTYLFNPANARPTLLFGAGAAGSMVALFLKKEGVGNLTVVEPDVVASHNAPMSLYGPADAGYYKTVALARHLEILCGEAPIVKREKYEGSPITSPAVVACVDEMGNKNDVPLKGRRLIWSKVRKNPKVEIFCDTRIAENLVEVYTIEPHDNTDIARYEALLFDDKEGLPQYCGMHGRITVSAIAAATVTASLTRFWTTGTKKWRFAFKCDTLEEVG